MYMTPPFFPLDQLIIPALCGSCSQETYEKILKTVEFFLSEDGINQFNTKTIVEDIAHHSFGALYPDFLTLSNMNFLDIAYDNGIIVCSAPSPGVTINVLVQNKITQQIFKQIAGMIDSPSYIVFNGYFSISALKHIVEYFYVRSAADMEAKDFELKPFLTKNKNIINLINGSPQERILPMMKIEFEGMKSLYNFYEDSPGLNSRIKKKTSTANKNLNENDIISMIFDVADIIDEETEIVKLMIDLEFGPINKQYWMAYCSLMEFDAYNGIKKIEIYEDVPLERETMFLISRFTHKSYVFSENSIIELTEILKDHPFMPELDRNSNLVKRT